jgi:hypothetical protein
MKKMLLALIAMINIAAASPKFDDVTIIVQSCDKYEVLWKPFYQLLFKHWPSLLTENKDVPILMITNKKEYKDPRITNIKIENEISWSDNMLTVLQHVKTKFVIILLEDYYITHFDESRLNEIMNIMRHDNIAYVQLSVNDARYCTGPQYPGIEGVRYKGRYDNYAASLQACAWVTDDLRHILKPGEGIWLFERAASVRSQGLRSRFLSVTDNYPIMYLNMAHMGYLISQNLEKAKKMGLEFGENTLPLDSDHKFKVWWWSEFVPYTYNDILLPLFDRGKAFFIWLTK